MGRRLIVLVAVALVGAAAPLRAWCEAACLAPAERASHCPSHGSTSDDTTLTAQLLEDCPVLESARPAPPARVDAQAALVATAVAPPSTRSPRLSSTPRSHRAATVFERSTPLRI